MINRLEAYLLMTSLEQKKYIEDNKNTAFSWAGFVEDAGQTEKGTYYLLFSSLRQIDHGWGYIYFNNEYDECLIYSIYVFYCDEATALSYTKGDFAELKGSFLGYKNRFFYIMQTNK